MHIGGYCLRGLGVCSKSCVAVAEVLHREFKDKFIDAESMKVLGMKWLATSDAFSFSIASLPDGLCITKRIVLSYLSRLFDPLGVAAPYVMGICKCWSSVG